MFFHNNVDNTLRFSYFSPEPACPADNIWDAGYISGGNYLSNYVDVDLYSGPDQNITAWMHASSTFTTLVFSFS